MKRIKFLALFLIFIILSFSFNSISAANPVTSTTKGADWLVKTQKKDGGWGDERNTVWPTYSLTIVYRNTGNQTYLNTSLKGADYLLERQHKNGRIGGIKDTSISIQAVLALYEETNDAKYLDAAEKASGYLISQQSPDGRIGDEEDTSYAVWALTKSYNVTSNSTYLGAAIDGADWLVSVQNTEGGDEDGRVGGAGKAVVAPTAVAIVALTDIYWVTGNLNYSGSAIRAADYMNRTQQGDGSWVGSIENTALSVYALSETAHPNYKDSARRGEEWLETRQQTQGNWGGSSETGMVIAGIKNYWDSYVLGNKKPIPEGFLATIAAILFGAKYRENRRRFISITKGMSIVSVMAFITLLGDQIPFSIFLEDWTASFLALLTNIQYISSSTVSFAGTLYYIGWECSSAFSLIIFWLVIYASKINIKSKILASILGLPIIFLANIIRIQALLLGEYYIGEDSVAWIHTLIGPMLMAYIVIGLWDYFATIFGEEARVSA